jgi:hypothetical protein
MFTLHEIEVMAITVVVLLFLRATWRLKRKARVDRADLLKMLDDLLDQQGR